MELSRYLEKGEVCGLALGAFLMGIAAHSFVPFMHADEVWIASALVACVMAAAAYRDTRIAVVAVVLSASAILGFWRFNISVPRANQGLLPWLGRGAVFQGRVLAQGTMRNQATLLVAVAEAGGRQIQGPAKSIFLRLKGQAPEIGTTTSFSCTPRVPGTFPANLERRRSLARKDVWSECSAAVLVETVKPPNPWDPLVWLARWRALLTARIASVLPPDEAELTTGILYGDQDLSAGMKDLFQRAGLMHLVAVSGSNVTIVVSVLLALVLALGFSRRRGFWIVSFGLLVFVGFVGCGASVLRAAIMGWLVILARHLGRLAWTSRLLLVAAAALNISNPWLLAFDPGFALSFLATWGLMSWSPIFQDRLKSVPNILACRESLAATCGATFMTAPYMAWVFGRMSLAGLMTNALALPLVPWTMLWAAVCAAWGNWPGWSVTSLPALGLVRLIIWISHLADFVPWLDLHLPQMDFPLLVAAYGTLYYWWRGLQPDGSNQKMVVDRSDKNN